MHTANLLTRRQSGRRWKALLHNQNRDARLAFVGDGINDAPVLCAVRISVLRWGLWSSDADHRSSRCGFDGRRSAENCRGHPNFSAKCIAHRVSEYSDSPSGVKTGLFGARRAGNCKYVDGNFCRCGCYGFCRAQCDSCAPGALSLKLKKVSCIQRIPFLDADKQKQRIISP